MKDLSEIDDKYKSAMSIALHMEVRRLQSKLTLALAVVEAARSAIDPSYIDEHVYYAELRTANVIALRDKIEAFDQANKEKP